MMMIMIGLLSTSGACKQAGDRQLNCIRSFSLGWSATRLRAQFSTSCVRFTSFGLPHQYIYIYKWFLSFRLHSFPRTWNDFNSFCFLIVFFFLLLFPFLFFLLRCVHRLLWKIIIIDVILSMSRSRAHRAQCIYNMITIPNRNQEIKR